MHYSSLDLFSGCGGLSAGLHKGGFETSLAVESQEFSANSFGANFPNSKVLNMDVREFLRGIEGKGHEYPKRGDFNVLCGGPPCQGFCGINRHRHIDDDRNSLVEVFLRCVAVLQPKVVIMENVNGILSLEDGSAIKDAILYLKELGYSAELNIVQTGSYGVPQSRWRVILIGLLDKVDKVEFIKPLHCFHSTTVFDSSGFKDRIIYPPKIEADLFSEFHKELTVRDAISDLPAISNGTSYTGKYNKGETSKYASRLRGRKRVVNDHECSNLGPVNLERVMHLPKGSGAGWTALPKRLQPKNLARVGTASYKNRFGRLYWEKTFSTIMTKPEPYWGRVIHPDQDRVISVRECARAQGFPDSFQFIGKMNQKYQMIGNAVAPPLGRAIAWSIRKMRGDKNVDEEIEAYGKSFKA